MVKRKREITIERRDQVRIRCRAYVKNATIYETYRRCRYPVKPETAPFCGKHVTWLYYDDEYHPRLES